MRVLAYYLFSILVLTFYGSKVCSFIETLRFLQWIPVLAVAFALALGARKLLVNRLVTAASPGTQVRAQFVIDLGLFLAIGIAVTVFDMMAYRFPVGSGVKVIVGCATLGFFGALDLALERERDLMRIARGAGKRLSPSSKRFSLTRKFTLVAAFTTLFGTLVVLLVVAKVVQGQGAAGSQKAILTEITFVMVVLFGLLMNLILSYSRNLKLFFDEETNVLERVTREDLDGYVPVTSQDEFGVIADRTNFMIDGLRERRRIKNVFGKVVSPEIAARLLANGDGEVKLGGTRHDLVILFSDVRSFTSLTERLAPEALVRDLNRYFSRMVEIIRKENGLVDKFIGDGILAVFGLDDPNDASERAVRAALAMQVSMKDLGPQLSEPFEIGIGLDRGHVIAGNIGSSERLEFTFIGDAVNTASRLEGLSKELGASIIVSSGVFKGLSAATAALSWKSFGPRALKGKAESVDVYGINPA